MYKPEVKRHNWKTQCAVCGFMFNSNELRERWDGLMVCSEDWEPRNILDFFRIAPEDISVPWTYPDKLSITNMVAITDADSPYTATSSILIISADATSGNIVINLPEANTYTFAESQTLTINRIDTSSNTVTVQRQGSDTINGATSETINPLGTKVYKNDAVSLWTNY